MNKFELIIYKLIAREIEINEFEQWVYSEKDLESFLSYDEYLNLISLTYKQPSSLYEAEKILKPHIDIGKYYEWYLRRVLQNVIEHPIDAHKYIEQCYDMYCDGYGFLDNLGLGYGLTVTVPPSEYNADSWDKLKSPEQKRLIESFYPSVCEEAEKVIGWLDTGKIVLTGHNGDFQGIQYTDSRTPEEKEPTGYKVATPQKKWWKLW
ncbi:hypothetical protein [Zooshikella ganghwensis]|uniref:hypothetical protein n=1 Tax=Zooshikella ganghwensis TaxID=202772 RepID=UPI0004215EE9|nr:hypothetical protein [Zooshikella ganghwensis]